MVQDDYLALLSMKSYVPPADLILAEDLHVTITKMVGHVDPSPSTVVAFRGTANVAGWLRDFSALPKSHPIIGYCHEGFLAGAAAIVQKLDIPPDLPTYFTGHSLGGALALVTAALRVTNGDRVDKVVTFGSPRAGYSALAWALDAAKVEVAQYRRGNDPVPLVPLDLIALPFRHVREPLIQVGVPQEPAILCHSIAGYVEDVTSRFLART